MRPRRIRRVVPRGFVRGKSVAAPMRRVDPTTRPARTGDDDGDNVVQLGNSLLAASEPDRLPVRMLSSAGDSNLVAMNRGRMRRDGEPEPPVDQVAVLAQQDAATLQGDGLKAKPSPRDEALAREKQGVQAPDREDEQRQKQEKDNQAKQILSNKQEAQKAGADQDKDLNKKEEKPKQRKPNIATARAQLRAWRSSNSQATAAIPKPGLGAAGDAPGRIGKKGKAAVGAQKKVAQKIPEDARKAAKKPKPKEPLPPLKDNPVTKADELVKPKLDLRLPDQTMPDLTKSPRGTLPKMGDRPQPESPPPKPGEMPAAPKAPENKKDQKTAEKLKKAGEKKPKADAKGKGNPLTLKDEPPPPSPPLPPAAKDAVGEVLARLMADPSGKAKKMLVEARIAAYPGGILHAKFKKIGEVELPGMTEALTTQLQMVAEEAGIADKELKEKVKAFQESLKKDKDKTQKDLDEKTKQQKDELKKVGQDQQDAVAGGRQALAVHNQNQVAAAGGKPDPAVINKQRRDLKSRISKVVGRAVGNYGQALKRRQLGLSRLGAIQKLAYKAAVQKDKKAIREEAGDLTNKSNKEKLAYKLKQAEIDTWGGARERAVGRAAGGLKLDAGEAADANKKAVRDAGREARGLIDAWADDKLGIEQSWWEKLWAWITSWFEEAEAEAEVWEQERASDTKKAILTDFAVLQQFQQKYGTDLKQVTEEQLKGLSEQQKAVIRAFYSKGGGNPITAVAAGLEKRLSLFFRPQLFKRFENELPEVDASRWEDLELVAQTQGSFGAFHICKEMYAAMFGGITGWGTDEDRIFAALGGLTKLQGITVRKCYRNVYKRDLDDDIDSELGGEDYRRAMSQLDGDKITAAVTELYQAMHGGLTGWGTDEDAIMRVMRGKSPEEIEAIKRKYKQLHGEDLESEFKSEMSSHDLGKANALLDGDTAKADAIALDQAMRGGWTGWGTDEEAINKVYADIRKEVEAEAASKGWDTKRMEAEIAKRKLMVEQSYNRKYGGDWKDSDESALRQAFKSEMEGPELDLANALADNDRMKADQARIAVEAKTSWFYVDDDVTDKVLENQYTRALDEVKRDGKWSEKQRKIREEGRKKGLSPYEIDAQIRAELAKLENQAKLKAKGYMTQLEQGYNQQYGGYKSNLRDVVGYEQQRKKKDGTTDKTHIRNKASELLDSGGYLEPHLRAYYAMDGVGTDEEELKKSLKGKTAAEIAEIKRKYKQMTGRELTDDIEGDTSGREKQELQWSLRGVPENAEQEFQLAQDKMDWELKNQSGFLAGKEKEVLQNRMDAMKRDFAIVSKMDPKMSPAEKARAWDKFRNRSGDVNSAIEGFVEQSNAVVDTLASAAAITATIIVVIVAAVLTGGAAAAGAPAVFAALGSALSSGTVAATAAVAAAAATVAVKASMKGDAYGWEEMAVDAAVGGVDAVVSFYTAGIGDKLLKAGRAGTLASQGLLGKGFKAIGGKQLGKMAIGPSRMGRMLAHGVAEGAEGLVSSFPSALTGNLLNDKNWEKGNAFLNITTGTLMETGMGAVVSGGMGTLGGIAKYKPKKPPTRPTGDILAHQPSLKDRAAAWKAFKQENPGADFKTWKKQFDEGVSQKLALGDAAKKQERAMRKELLRDIPPAQRKQFAKAPIHVLSDAEFKALTGSGSGKAVVLFEKGKARIILRAGADIKKLREEGIHLLQSVEKETRKKVAKLDERVLRNWDKLSLDKKLDLYQTKVDLEIDAHQRLIKSLKDDLDAANDPALKKALKQQLDDAQHNLSELNKRMREVKSIGPDEKALIHAGHETEPPYLDKPARLFSKESKTRQLRKKQKELREALEGQMVTRKTYISVEGKEIEVDVEYDLKKELDELIDTVLLKARKTKKPYSETIKDWGLKVSQSLENLKDRPEELLDALHAYKRLADIGPKFNFSEQLNIVDLAMDMQNPARFLNDIHAFHKADVLSNTDLDTLAKQMKQMSGDQRVEFLQGVRRQWNEAKDMGLNPPLLIFFKDPVDNRLVVLKNTDGAESTYMAVKHYDYPEPPPNHYYQKQGEEAYALYVSKGGKKTHTVDFDDDLNPVLRELKAGEVVSDKDAFLKRKNRLANSSKSLEPGFSDFEKRMDVFDRDLGKLDAAVQTDIQKQINIDKGVLRNYKNAVKLIYEQLPSSERKDFLDRIFKGLDKIGEADNEGGVHALTQSMYRRFRKNVRKEIETFVGGLDSQKLSVLDPDTQEMVQKRVLDLLLDSAPNESAKGHILTAYRGGRLSGSSNVELLDSVPSFNMKSIAKQVDGDATLKAELDGVAKEGVDLSSKGSAKNRKPDGVLKIKKAYRNKSAPRGLGEFVIDDKAGLKAFKPKQAVDYAMAYLSGTMGNAKGVIYICDSLASAEEARNALERIFKKDFLNRRDGGIFVAYFDDNGDLAWYP